MSRPTDEITGKVVAKWMGWEGAAYEPEPCMGHKTVFSAVPTPGTHPIICPDPRTDDGAAMRLLHHIASKGPYVKMLWNEHEWFMSDHESKLDLVSIPISGEPFRYAVVNLAADVLGVG